MDPTLLDELPILGDILTEASPELTEELFEAFHVQAVYSKELHQVTIHITLTDTTPHAVNRLLADPRTTPAKPATTTPPAGTFPFTTHPYGVVFGASDPAGSAHGQPT